MRWLPDDGTALEPAESASSADDASAAPVQGRTELAPGASSTVEREAARVSASAPSATRSVRLVDAASGAPVAGMPYRVLDPSRTKPLVRQGISDAEGLLDLADVRRRAVVVETERRPPHALGAQVVDLADEAVTDAAGAFEFELTPRRYVDVRVFDREGIGQEFERSVEFDERGVCDLGALRLEALRACTLRLVDEAGEPLDPEAFAFPGNQSDANWDVSRARSTGNVYVLVLDESGRTNDESLIVGDGGIVGFVPEFEPRSIRSVRIVSANFRPTRVPLPEGFDPERILLVPLAPMPELTVRVEPSGDFPDLRGFRLSVHACAASRAAREALLGGSLDAQERLDRVGGFGLGCARLVDWRCDEMTARFPVLTDDPYWIYLRGRGSTAELLAQVHGPFRPGSRFRTVTLPASALRTIDVPEELPESRPGTDRWSHAVVTLTDAETGERIPRGTLKAVPTAGARGHGRTAGLRPREDGRSRAQLGLTGRYALSVGATGYRYVDVGEYELERGETAELGTVALETTETFRIRLVDAEGSPVSSGIHVFVRRSQEVVGDDGVLTVVDELPQEFLITIGSFYDSYHVVPVHGWNPDGMREVRLERYGDDYHPRPHAAIGVVPLRGASLREPGTVSFAARLAVGSWRVELASPLYDMPPTVVEIVPGEGTQVIPLRATR